MKYLYCLILIALAPACHNKLFDVVFETTNKNNVSLQIRLCAGNALAEKPDGGVAQQCAKLAPLAISKLEEQLKIDDAYVNHAIEIGVDCELGGLLKQFSRPEQMARLQSAIGTTCRTQHNAIACAAYQRQPYR